MSDTNRNDPNTGSAANGPAGASDNIPVSTFEVVPYGATASEKDLYSFREAMPRPPAPVPAKKHAPLALNTRTLLAIGAAALAAVLALALYSVFGHRTKVSYMDLGSQRFDPGGLSGRLIARWDTSGSYQLYIDPIGPNHAADFAHVAADPPRQLSISIRLLDVAGLAICEKQILFPAPLPRADDGDSTPAQSPPVLPQGPRQSETGDTVENMTGESGQIAEIDVRGPLPCPAQAYGKFKTWDFTADFPTPAEEDEWMQQEKNLKAKNHAKGKPGVRTQRLGGPIEGDDVIVADNPSHGTVETSAGRVFFLGAHGIRNRTSEWQTFPAAIHFRCDKSGLCALTRANSHIVLQARLVR